MIAFYSVRHGLVDSWPRVKLTMAYLVQSFIARISEWGLSIIVLVLGMGLLSPGDTFDYASGLWRMLTVMSETSWGIVMIVVGVISLLALWRNGAQPRLTSAARVACAMVRSTIWLVYSVSLLQASLQTDRFIIPFVGIAPIFVLMDWAVLVRATLEHRDAG